MIDTDIQSPGIHIIFGLRGEQITSSLNDYLWHGKEITETALNVTQNLTQSIKGQLYLIPSSIKAGEIARVLREGYNAELLTQGIRQLVDALSLDFLFIDTHPGLNEETLLSLILAHVLIIILRPDQQDYEGTGVTLRVASQLEVPRITMLINKVPPSIELEAIKTKVKETYQSEVLAAIPFSLEMMDLGSRGIFAAHFPHHAITETYQYVDDMLKSPDLKPGD